MNRTERNGISGADPTSHTRTYIHTLETRGWMDESKQACVQQMVMERHSVTSSSSFQLPACDGDVAQVKFVYVRIYVSQSMAKIDLQKMVV